jgi:uncharacterized protein
MTEVESAKAAPPPWGIIATCLWFLLAYVLSLVVSIVALALWTGGQLDVGPEILGNGPLLALMTIISAVVQIGTLAFVARLRGWGAADYLGWIVPNARDAGIAFAVMVAFVLAYDVLTYLLHRDVVTPFQVDTYRSAREAGGLLMLWLTFVIAAPLSEEIVFRGFLYRGWAPSRRAVIPAVLLISALWAVFHIQYDWFGVLQIFLIGLVLGWVRWRTGSTLLTFGLHAMINTWAMVETIAKLEWLA